MATGTFAELKGHNGKLIRKVLRASVFVKLVEDDDEEITQLWGSSGLIVPDGYNSMGIMSKDDGISWTRDQDMSEETGLGYAEPLRTDITSDVNGLQATFIESNRLAMEVYHNRDLSNVVTDADGNFYFDKPSRPATRRYRLLALGVDGDGPEAIYVARWIPQAQVTENGEQSWKEDEAIHYPATFRGFTDEQFGTSFREIWGGPGLDQEAMGFPAPSA